jgi:hypothetical protein
VQSVATVHAWAGGGASGSMQPPAAALHAPPAGQTVSCVVMGPGAQVYVCRSHGTMGTTKVLSWQ